MWSNFKFSPLSHFLILPILTVLIKLLYQYVGIYLYTVYLLLARLAGKPYTPSRRRDSAGPGLDIPAVRQKQSLKLRTRQSVLPVDTSSSAPTSHVPCEEKAVLSSDDGVTPRDCRKNTVLLNMSPHLKSLAVTRSYFIDHTVIAQLDGLIHAVFRVRLEVDLCAKSTEDSYCQSYGRQLSPMSSFVALIFPDALCARDAVIACARQLGTALFIVRSDPCGGEPLPKDLGGRNLIQNS